MELAEPPLQFRNPCLVLVSLTILNSLSTWWGSVQNKLSPVLFYTFRSSKTLNQSPALAQTTTKTKKSDICEH
jgi:hypothetical protein